jgi:hypothetical protein
MVLMRAELVAVAIGVGSTVWGCAKAVDLRAIAAQGKDNELSVVYAYTDKELEIRGRVVTVAQGELRGENATFQTGTQGTATATTYATRELIPYVQLAPEDGSQDLYAYCFLEAYEIGSAATLKSGDSATVVGVFSSYHHEGGIPRLVLSHCRLTR